MGKIIETRKLYKEVIEDISKSEENWQNFLDSSSWNFKYDFDDQILIYAQRPDAKACATMEEWNKKLKRWVNGGTKPIYIFDKNPHSEYPFKLVFDLSDTHNYNHTEYKLWSIKKEYEQDIIESLEASFGDIDNKESLSQAIINTSYNMVLDNMEDYLTSIINNKANSMFADLSDDDIKSLFITTAWASVSYMLMTRCGINAREEIQTQEFSYIKYFNTQESITTLGASVSDIAEMGLREIARTVASLQKNEKVKNRIIENIDKEMYSKDNEKDKGGNEDGRENTIHETGRILYAQPSNEERENTSRQILSNEIQLSKESQELRIDQFSNESKIEGTSNGSTGTGEPESREPNRANEETGWSNRGTKSERPDEMGRTTKQLQNDSRGDSSERTNLYLEENTPKRRILTKEEMKTDRDFLQDKYTSALLSNIKNLSVTRNEIKEFYKTHLDINERVEYIKQVFNDAYTEIVIDDVRLGYKTYENVLHLWKDNYLNRTAEVYYKWKTVAEYIEGLILINEFNDLHKPVLSYSDQMQILQVEAEIAPTFSFSQEIIDYALTGGSNFRESKMRIYNQFENSLSSDENIKFLKNEYGWGGSSSIHIGTNVGIDYNGKGITLNRGYGDEAPKILLPWNKVEKRISELIKADRYLNSKEKEEYSNWLKKQEQEKELRESEKKLAKQEQQQKQEKEHELATRVYSFVKPSDLYNYTDDSVALNTDEENIEIVKADISDTRNVKDYVNALNKARDKAEYTDTQKYELDVLISILEKRVPHYEYHLGDTVYIGADEYEIAGIKDNIVTLYDVKFPLFNKQMDFEEFERKVQDNYANDHLKVKDIGNIEEEISSINNELKQQENIELTEKENQNNFDLVEFEKNIPYNMRFKSCEQIDRDLYWVTQEVFTKADLYKFKEALKDTNFEKAYVTVRDLSNYDVEADLANNVFAIVTKDNINDINYFETARKIFSDEVLELTDSAKEKQKEREEKSYKVGQEVYLESEKKYRIDKIELENEKISLQDLSINYPIFREESILTFENLYNQNERNFPEQNIKPNFVKARNKIQDFILHPEVAISDRNNYKITDDNLGVGTSREKFERNIAAIKVLKKCEQENRYATPEEQEILSKYIGWGGLPQAFEENNSSWSNEYNILKDLLNEEEYKNARSSTLTAFYTPPIVINAMYEILQNMGLKEANILEPSCGVGNFFGMLPTELENCKMYGVELDSISGRIAQQLYQKSTIAVNGYEKVDLPDSFFDVAIRKCTFWSF